MCQYPHMMNPSRKSWGNSSGWMHTSRRPFGSVGASLCGAGHLLFLWISSFRCAGHFFLQVESCTFMASTCHFLVLSVLLCASLLHGGVHFHCFGKSGGCKQMVLHQRD